MATTYYSGPMYLDGILVDPTAIEDFEGTLPVFTLDAAMGNQAVMVLPGLTLSASSDDLLWCGELNSRETPVVLPTLSLDARFGQLDSVEQTLPAFELSAFFAPRLEDDLNLPVLVLSASITFDELASLTRTLPDMTLEGRSGLRANDTLNLPSLSISAGLETSIKGTLTKGLTFPTLTVEISSDGWGGVLSKDLTFPALSASISEDYTLSLNATLPGMQITATGLSGDTLTLAATLPDLQINAVGLSEEFGSLNANLPTPVMQDVASGDGSGQGEGRLTDRERFDDYILRHSRW